MIKEKFFAYEKYFFLLVTLANLIPILNFSFLVTLDGPDHLFNAALLKHLFTGNGGAIPDFFCIHHWQFTNWTGNLIMAFFDLFLPAWLVEKLLMAIIVIGLPYAFRGFVNNLATEKSLLSYLIFPFTWSQIFFNGFFNFLLGVVFMFVLLILWTSPGLKTGFKKWILIFLCFLIGAGSHIFPFVLGVLIAAGWTIWKMLVPDTTKSMEKFSKRLWQAIRELAFLFSASVGGLFVLVCYLLIPMVTSGSSGTGMDLKGSLNDIRIVKPLLALDIREQMFTAKFFYWLCLMTAVAGVIRLIGFVRSYNQVRKTPERESIIHPSDYFFGIAVLFFALFIVYNIWFETGFYIWLCLIPCVAGIIKLIGFVWNFRLVRKTTERKRIIHPSDYFLGIAVVFFALFIVYNIWLEIGYYINARYLLLAFIIWIGWLAVQRLPRWFALLSVFMVLLLNFTLITTREKIYSSIRQTADEFIVMAYNIEPGSVVYTKNYSRNWILYHVVNYLGAERPMVILDNNECRQPFCPLQFKPGKAFVKAELDFSYPDISNIRSDGTKAFDYLLTYSDIDVLNQKDYIEFRQFIDKRFKLLAISPNGSIKLYKPKE